MIRFATDINRVQNTGEKVKIRVQGEVVYDSDLVYTYDLPESVLEFLFNIRLKNEPLIVEIEYSSEEDTFQPNIDFTYIQVGLS